MEKITLAIWRDENFVTCKGVGNFGADFSKSLHHKMQVFLRECGNTSFGDAVVAYEGDEGEAYPIATLVDGVFHEYDVDDVIEENITEQALWW